MINVGGNDRPPARHLLADEFGRHEFGNGGPEALAVGEAARRVRNRRLARQILAVGDVNHLLGHDSGAGEFQLGDELPGTTRAQRPRRRAERRKMVS